MNWISVKDRLPASNQDKENILFQPSVFGSIYRIGRFYNGRFEFWSERYEEWQDEVNVTHWCEVTGPETNE